MTVEDNILAILETRDLGREERHRQLERMLDELSIKHLRQSQAYALSGGERRRLEITRALVTEPKFMLLDEPFAGVDPIAVHDIQTIVAGLRHRGIGVLITDHNVEQTLDIVDRAYIMFEGKVQASGNVRELVYDDRVAQLYLGPTLTARLRAPTGVGGMRTGLSQHTSMRQELQINPRLYQAMDMLYMPMMDLQQHLKQELLTNPFLELLEPEDEDPGAEGRRAGEGAEGEGGGDRLGGDPPQRLRGGRDARAVRAARVHRAGHGRDRDLIDHLREQLQHARPVTARQLLLAEEFLGNINDDGYLAASLEEILGSVNQLVAGHVAKDGADGDDGEDGEVSTAEGPVFAAASPSSPSAPSSPSLYTQAEVEEMLAIIQRLDPPGIGARDLRECLLLQLGEQADTDIARLPAGARRLSGPDRPPLERSGQALRHRARRGADGGRRAGPARSQARAQARERERRLHHPRPHRREDRRPVPRLPQRHQHAAPPAQPRVPGDRARQEEVRRRRTRSSSPTR